VTENGQTAGLLTAETGHAAKGVVAVAYSDNSNGDVSGVDVSGWVEQYKGRDVYEVVREPVQNALDTGSDLYVRVDYGDQSITVEDYGDGVEDLSQFYDLFPGDKPYDPEKRGRFGRGIKEFIEASDETVTSSTGSGLRFAFDAAYDEALEEYVVDASRELYPDAELERQYPHPDGRGRCPAGGRSVGPRSRSGRRRQVTAGCMR